MQNNFNDTAIEKNTARERKREREKTIILYVIVEADGFSCVPTEQCDTSSYRSFPIVNYLISSQTRVIELLLIYGDSSESIVVQGE